MESAARASSIGCVVLVAFSGWKALCLSLSVSGLNESLATYSCGSCTGGCAVVACSCDRDLGSAADREVDEVVELLLNAVDSRLQAVLKPFFSFAAGPSSDLSMPRSGFLYHLRIKVDRRQRKSPCDCQWQLSAVSTVVDDDVYVVDDPTEWL